MYDSVYFNPFDNFNQWYTPYEESELKTIYRLNRIIFNKVKVQSINDDSITNEYSNKLRVDASVFGDVYFCDDANNKYQEKFQGNNYIMGVL